MDPLTRVIRQTARDLWRQIFLSTLGWCLLVASAVAVVSMVLNLSLSLGLPRWHALVIVLIGAAIAPVLAYRKRVSPQAAAVHLDTVLGLKDRFATALYLRSNKPKDPLAQEVFRQAADLATGVNVRQAVPLTYPKVLRWVGAALVTMVLLSLLPEMDLLGLSKARTEKEQKLTQSEQVKNELAQAAKELQEQASNKAQPSNAPDEQHPLTQPGTPGAPPVTLPEKPAEQPMNVAQRLAELSKQDLTDPENQRKAASELSKASDELDQQARKEQAQAQQVDNAMSRLETQSHGPADDFVQALRRGDYQAAQQELKDLSKRSETMSEADKTKAAGQLQEVSKQLQEISRQQAEQQKQAQQNAEQPLRQAGVEEKKVQELRQQQMPPQQVQKALQDKGQDTQTAKQNAEAAQQAQ